MIPYLQDADLTLYNGEALDVLRALPDESVQMCVTSPPYWSLRDYGTGHWEGGDPDCDHEPDRTSASSTLEGGNATQGQARIMPSPCTRCGAVHVDQQIGLEATPEEYVAALVEIFAEVRRVLRADATLWLNLGDSYSGSGDLKPKDLVGIPWRVAFALQADGWVLRSDVVWSKSNPIPESVTDRPTKSHEYLFILSKAKWVGSIEPTPMAERDAAWLAALVDGEGSICFQERANKEWAPTVSPRLSVVNTNRALLDRVAEITALAVNKAPSPRLRGDGSDGRPMWTWQITDKKAARIITAIRPYLIAKRTQADLALAVYALNAKMKGRGNVGRTTDADLAFKRRAAAACSDLNRGRETDLTWFTPPRDGRWIPQSYHFDQEAVREPHQPGSFDRVKANSQYAADNPDRPDVPYAMQSPPTLHPAGRNVRSVWEIATQAYKGAHFATFPEELARRCILAGTSERGCCPECGAPWVREVSDERVEVGHGGRSKPGNRDVSRKDHGTGAMYARVGVTLGWRPSCDCPWQLGGRGRDEMCHYPPDPVPCTVLDPFGGSGTTGLVARKHGRRSILIELNADYCALVAKRTQQLSLVAEGTAA